MWASRSRGHSRCPCPAAGVRRCRPPRAWSGGRPSLRDARPPQFPTTSPQPSRIIPPAARLRRVELASNPPRLRCVPAGVRAGVVEDRTAPAHRTRSESKTSRSSCRLRLGRHRHRRGRSVWTTERERLDCGAASMSARRHRRWRDTISETERHHDGHAARSAGSEHSGHLETSHRPRRREAAGTPAAGSQRAGHTEGTPSTPQAETGRRHDEDMQSAPRARRRAAAVRHRSAHRPASRVDDAAATAGRGRSKRCDHMQTTRRARAAGGERPEGPRAHLMAHARRPPTSTRGYRRGQVATATDAARAAFGRISHPRCSATGVWSSGAGPDDPSHAAPDRAPATTDSLFGARTRCYEGA